MHYFWFGIALELLAGMMGTTGKQLVSLSARQPAGPEAKRLKYAGLFITTLLGPLADASAYGFASQSVVAPLNGLDVVWNVLSAPITLGEKLLLPHLVGAGLVFLGAMLTAVFGPHHSTSLSPAALHQRFFSWSFTIYCSVLLAGLCLSTVLLQSRPKGSGGKVRAICLGATAGAIAGNMFFCSAALGLLKNSCVTGDWSAWCTPLPYAMIVGMLVVALGNIPFMSRGLQEFEAVFMVTLFEGCHIAVACISGQVVLQEMDRAEPWQLCCYWASAFVIIAGLWVIQTTSVGGIVRPPAMADIDMSVESSPSVMWAGSLSGIGVRQCTPSSSLCQPCESSSSTTTPTLLLAQH